MPEPNSLLINRSSDTETRVENRWDLLPDHNPSSADIDRYQSENGGYLNGRLQFHSRPLHLPISPSNTEPTLPSNFELTPKQCYDFCWKTCAIYCLVDPNTLGMRPTMLDFYHAIYRCWFRGDETNARQANFFGKCIASWKEADTGNDDVIPKRLLTAQPNIQAIIATHRALCTQIETGLAKPPSKESLPYHAYQDLKPTFEKVLVVMDTVNWDWEGLLIVRSDQALPLRLDCNNFDIPAPAFREGDQGQVFRARLEDVIRLVESMRIREDEGRMWPGLVGKV